MILSCPSCSARFKLPDMVLGGKPRKVRCSRCAHLWEARPEDGLPEPSPNRKSGAKVKSGAEAKKTAKKKKLAAAAPAMPADEPDERFPGMGDFKYPDPEPLESAHQATAHFDEDVWMNASASHHQLNEFDSDTGREQQGLGAKIRGLSRWIGFFVSVAGLVVFLLSSRNQIVELWPAAARFYDVIGLPAELPGAGLELQNYKSELRVESGVTVLALEGQIVNVSPFARDVPILMATSKNPDNKPIKRWRVTVTPGHLAPGAIAIFRSTEQNPGAISTIDLNFTMAP